MIICHVTRSCNVIILYVLMICIYWYGNILETLISFDKETIWILILNLVVLSFDPAKETCRRVLLLFNLKIKVLEFFILSEPKHGKEQYTSRHKNE